LFAIQILENGDDEGEGLSRTSFGSTEDVGAMKGERDGACLDGCEGGEMASL